MDNIQVINKEAALERLGSDEELYNEVLDVFFEDTPIQLGNLQQALNNNVIAEVARLSHSLKSAAGNVGADRMSAASKKTEMAAKSGSLEGLAELIQSIQHEFATLAQHLNRSA